MAAYPEGSAEDLAQELFAIEGVIDSLKQRKAQIEQELVVSMTEKRLEVPGYGVFEKKEKRDRKAWKHDELFSALIGKIRTDEIPHETTADFLTGEVTHEDDTARAFRVLKAVANPSWRVTSLRAFRLDADEFCEVTPGGWTIQIHDEVKEWEVD